MSFGSKLWIGLVLLILPSLCFAELNLNALDQSLGEHEYLRLAFHQMLQDRSLAPILRRNLEAAERTTIGKEHPAKIVVLAMALHENTRRVMVNALLAEKQHQSLVYVERAKAATKKILEAEAGGKKDITALIDSETQVGDVLVIGGTGPAGTQIELSLQRHHSNHKVMILEQQDSIGGTFDSLMFLLNTANRPSSDAAVPRFRSENDNEIIDGILQVPEIDPRAYPVARSMADVLKINLGMSDALIQFNQKVVEIQDKEKVDLKVIKSAKSWPARYRVKAIDRDGSVVYHFYNIIADAGGIGAPTVPVKSEAAAKLITSQFESFEADPSKDIRILNFGIASKRIDALERPMLPYVDKKILVVGDSVAARDFILWLMRRGPDESYKGSNAQEGRYKEILWVGVDEATIEQWLKNNRLFYGTIAAAIKNQSLKFTGKTYMSDISASYDENGTIRELTVSTEFKDRGKEAFTGDVVFLGTGYKRDESMYKQMVEPSQQVDVAGKPTRLALSKAVVDIKAPAKNVINAEGATTNDVAIAKQIVGEDIYLISASGLLVQAGEVPGSSAGSPLMKDNLPRVRAWVEQVLMKTVPAGFRKVREPLIQPISERVSENILSRHYKNVDLRFPVPGADDVYLRARVDAALAVLNINDQNLVVTVSSVGDGKFEVRTNSAQDDRIAKKLATELQSDLNFIETLAANTNSTTNQIEFILGRNIEGRAAVVSVRYIANQMIVPKSALSVEQNNQMIVSPQIRKEMIAALKAGKSEREVFEKYLTADSGWVTPIQSAKDESLKSLEVAFLTYDDKIIFGKVIDVEPIIVGTGWHEGESSYRGFGGGSEIMRTHYMYKVQLSDGSIETVSSENLYEIRINDTWHPTRAEFENQYNSWRKSESWRSEELFELKGGKVALLVRNHSKHNVTAIVEGEIVGFLDRDKNPITFLDEIEARFLDIPLGELQIRIADPKGYTHCAWLLSGKSSDSVVSIQSYNIEEVRTPTLAKSITEDAFHEKFKFKTGPSWKHAYGYDLVRKEEFKNRRVELLISRGGTYSRNFTAIEGKLIGVGKQTVRLRVIEDDAQSSKNVDYLNIEIQGVGVRKVPLEDIRSAYVEPASLDQRIKW